MHPSHELAAIERAERDAALDDLLSRWHHWQTSDSGGRGFGSRALVVGDYQTSRQYDDTNGALDAALNARECKAIEFAVGVMAELDRVKGTSYALALRVHARALYLGTTAIRNPRLPEGEQLAALISQARALLIGRLVSAGVIS